MAVDYRTKNMVSGGGGGRIQFLLVKKGRGKKMGGWEGHDYRFAGISYQLKELNNA